MFGNPEIHFCIFYLSIDTDDRILQTKSNIDQLQRKYRGLVIKTQKFVCQKSPDIAEFRSYITLSAKAEHQKYLEKYCSQIYQAKSVEEVFGWLNLGVWGYLNFGLLQYIVEVYEEDELIQSMEEYVAAVGAFRKETVLHDFMEAQPKGERLEIPSDLERDLKKVMFEHRDLTPTSTLEKVEIYRQDLARLYSLPDFVFILAKIEPGSVTTVWLVAPSIANTLKHGRMTTFLQQHSIHEMKIDGTTIYRSGD